MNGRLHWLIIALLIAGLAGLTWWMPQALSEGGTALLPGAPRHAPDLTVEHFQARVLDEQGRIKYRLAAARMAHFPDDRTSEFEAPRLTQYQPGEPPVHTRADRGHLQGDGKVLRFIGNVQVSRGGSADDAIEQTSHELRVVLE